MAYMKSPAFQFYPSDWLSSRAVRLMDAEQRGWYIQLLAEAWQSRPQATLPNDHALLIRLAEADTKSADFDARWAFVLGQFTVKAELLINARLAKEKKKQNAYHEQRKSAGEKGAAKRWRERVENKRDTAKVSHSLAIAKPPLSYVSANGGTMPLQSSSSSSISSSTSEVKKRRAAKPRDPRLDHPALKAVIEVKGCYPNKDTWDLVIKVVGAEPNIEEMRNCWVEWRSRDYAPGNLGWLTDWYLNGVPSRNGNKRGAYVDPAKGANRDPTPRPKLPAPPVSEEELRLLGIRQ